MHSAAVAHEGNPQTSSVYGLLFTINYTVIRSVSYSPLQILRAVITNDQSPVSLTTRDGTYGIPLGQGFSLTAYPDSPRIAIGSKANVTLDISSYGGYAGTIDLTLGTQLPVLLLSLNATSTPLSPNHPSNVTLTIATDATNEANQYTVMVTATSNGLSHTATVSILTTDKPDFILDALPLILEIHATPQPDFSFLLSGTGRIIQAGESRTFTLTMTSIDYFKGKLYLFASSRFGLEEVFSP